MGREGRTPSLPRVTMGRDGGWVGEWVGGASEKKS